ncbi:BTB/POZ and MATH domain-containing protein 2-like [Lolium rigidum]|uniref:BTB/POZ and MATH domain-containing protein 2-like n=1 Tax=Lolium rigidum TaxID=89674 RepID=UPI001F5DDA20|nr:BTB/POZ and MATH domain-containing protein 2-like [Lolium rigidum]
MATTTWMHHAARSVQGSHVFEISGYSLHRDVLCAYANVPSAVFRVGGYQWQIAVYPGGIFEYYKDYLSVYVYLVSKNVVTRVRASVQLSLVDVTRSSPPHTMTTEIDCTSGCNSFCGIHQFKKRSKLEGSPYLRDDRLTIECIITLDKESLIQSSVEVSLPPSDIIDHLQKLLQAKEGTDVIFEVQGEVFPAHRTVLAMRSPVFKAELYGPMREKDMSRITISDMQPAVFEILLHFIYTDSLSTPDDLGHDEYEETIMHLLVAADRYAMERLKMICEDILRSNINTSGKRASCGGRPGTGIDHRMSRAWDFAFYMEV